MIKIKFKNEEILREVEFSQINKSTVQLLGDIPKNTSGFHTYKQNGVLIGDFTDYTTVYKHVDGGVQFSNNGSTVVVPPEPEHQPITFAEMKEQLETVKEENIKIKTELETTKKQLTDAQIALCDVYELVMG